MRIVRSRCLPGLVVLTLSLSAPVALTQDRPSFEVASVRPIGPIDPGGWGRRSPVARSSGQFDAADKLRSLIIWAFRVDGNLIEGNSPILDDGFLIAAKAPGPVLLAPPGEVGPMNLMMQSLLAERFKLQVRWETRRFPVYVLRRTMTDRLGRNLKRFDASCPPGYPENINAAPDGCFVKLSGQKQVNGMHQIQGIVPRIADPHVPNPSSLFTAHAFGVRQWHPNPGGTPWVTLVISSFGRLRLRARVG